MQEMGIEVGNGLQVPVAMLKACQEWAGLREDWCHMALVLLSGSWQVALCVLF